MVTLTAENSEDGLQAEELFVVLDRNVAILEQDLEGRQHVLEVLDGHQVAELCQAVKNWVEQLDAAGLGSAGVSGRQGLENAEVDGEEDVGDVGGEAEPGLSRFLASSFQKLLVKLGAFLGSLFLALALKMFRRLKISARKLTGGDLASSGRVWVSL